MSDMNDKISVGDFKAALAANRNDEFTLDWHGLTLHIKARLSLTEMASLVRGVVTACFASDTNEYLPEVRDFATRGAVLETYTNLTLPDNLEEWYDMVYGSDIFEVICRYIDYEQYESMLDAINKKIANIAQSNVEALNKQMEELVAGFNELEDKLSQTFSGVDNATIRNIASAVSNGSFDENKLVQAFSNQIKHKDNIVQMPTTKGE